MSSLSDQREARAGETYRRVEAVEALVLVNLVAGAGCLDPIEVRRHHVHDALKPGTRRKEDTGFKPLSKEEGRHRVQTQHRQSKVGIHM